MSIKINIFFNIVLGMMFSMVVLPAAVITMEANTTNVQPNEQIRYTISLDYDGSNGLLSNTEVNDTIPAGTTYVGGTVSPAAAQYPADGSTGETIIWRLGSNVVGLIGNDSSGGSTVMTSYGVKDEFGTVAYTNNDGNVSWSANWTEENDNDSASNGNIYITNDQLRINSTSSLSKVYREVDLTNADATSATLTLDLISNSLTHNQDVVIIEVSYNGGSSWTQIKRYQKNTAGGVNYSLNVGGVARVRINHNQYKHGGNIIFDNAEVTWTESTVSGGTADYTTELTPSSLLATTDGSKQIIVTMEINNTQSDTNIVPSGMTITGFDGAGAFCTAGSPASQDITAGGSIQFDYTCTLTVGSGQGTVKFSANAAGDTYTYATGTSATVIVVPPLTFVVQADDPAPAEPAKNSAWISSYSPLSYDECFAISDETNTVYHLDLGDATATALTQGTGVSNIEALKFNLDYSVLYGINADQLGTIDQTTGVFTATTSTIGTVGGASGEILVTDADGMTFDPINGELYVAVRLTGTPIQNDIIIKVDPVTGAHVPDAFGSPGSGIDYLEVDFPDAVDAGIDDIDGMSFYPDGTLYAIQNNGGANDYLTIIDKTDGTVSNVGRVEDQDGAAINDLESLSFMPDGTLYAASGAAEPNGVLYKIDRTNATMLSKGTIADGGDYEGLTCIEADSNLAEEIIMEQSNDIVTTLPVTIAYVYPVDYGGQIELDFSTATETSNIGFNIYAIKGKRWIKLNEEMIEGAMDSLVPVDYHTTLELPEDMKIRKIGIAGVDVDGVEDRHGPYKIGEESGSKTEITLINWKQVNTEVKKDKKARKAKRKAKRASRKALRKTMKDQIVNLDVSEDAVYRITHEDLMAVDIDLRGFKANRIAVSLRGEGVTRHIDGLTKKSKWTKESSIEFMGTKPEGSNALYLDKNRYRLSLNKKLVVESEGIEPSSAKELVFEANNAYSWTIPSSDPFYDKMFYTRGAGKPGVVTRTFTLEEVPDAEMEMTVYVSGFSNLTHNLTVSLNGSEIGGVQQSGHVELPIGMTVDAATLHKGENEITITAHGEETNIDVFTYDKTVISYDDGEANEVKTPVITFNDRLRKKEIKPKRGTTYLIISHPLFIGETLDRYVAQKEGEGWKIQVVDVEDIYSAYGYGMATPDAIKAYLKVAKRKGVTHVQLVGAASYDYLDTLRLGSVSFIPSLYVPTGTRVQYTPCDGCLVADENGIPELAIGRWPVRTTEGLESIINKTLAWSESGQSSTHTALMIADTKEEGTNFATQMDSLAQQFEESGNWNSVARVYMDDKFAQAADKQEAITSAREEIMESLNSGVSIVSYAGHSSTVKWSYKKLLTQNDVASVDNQRQTALALPLACYTNYADSPSINTMTHQFLAGGENGFVAIYGAATLSNFSQNGVSAAKVTDHLLKGETIGEAVLHSKRELGIEYSDIIRNANLLGDVTLKID